MFVRFNEDQVVGTAGTVEALQTADLQRVNLNWILTKEQQFREVDSTVNKHWVI